MATFSRRMLKLIAVAGTVPAVGIAIGYRMRALQAGEGGSVEEKRIYRACDLPIYPVAGPEPEPVRNEPYPRNALEQQIGVVRKSVQEFLKQYEDTFQTLKTTTETGIEHSKASLDYIQNNPGELPRIAFIALAGMGGVVLAYRGGPMKKLFYGSVAAVAAASLCYPNKSVELSQEVTNAAKEAWNDIIGVDSSKKYWPFKDPESLDGDEKEPQANALPTVSETSESNENPSKEESKPSTDKKVKNFGTPNTKIKIIKGDPGQSNPKDKDMYSTRSS